VTIKRVTALINYISIEILEYKTLPFPNPNRGGFSFIVIVTDDND